MSALPAHAVALSVDDDLRRSRLTVFFRLLLALPHLVWLLLWTIVAVVAAVANWLATLVRGTPPSRLHRFLSAYVRYETHVLAYLTLAANPYPGFTGRQGSYPVDIRLPAPAPQTRWTVALRLLLAVPALVLVGVLLPGSAGREADDASTAGGVLALVACLGWFAALVTGRMPHGLRNFAAYGLRYNAEAASYLLLLTGRYPNSDPLLSADAGAAPERAIRLWVADDLRRSRLTVFFRLLLVLPHVVWLVLWSLVMLVASAAAWLAALATGRLPDGLHGFLAAYVRYATHVQAFALLAANPFPGFTGAPRSYPVELEIDAPARQGRAVTFFRLFLALPALVLEAGLAVLAVAAAFLGWFAALAAGRMPNGLRNVVAWYLRYQGEASGYVLLLTDRYPYSGPPIERPPEPEPEGETTAVDA